jgi:outer membrane autotransporter protein
MVAYDTPLIPLRDVSLGREIRVGVGVGYARSQIDGNPIGTGTSSTNFNTYQATAYISQERGPWFVDGDMSFGWNDYSGTRNISIPGFNQTANAGYSGQDYTAFVTTGYHFLTRGFTITPIASLQYTHVNLDSYTETGAGTVDLKVNSQSYDFVESGLGVKAARPFAYHDDGTYVPEIHFKWLHELYNPTLVNTATLTAPGSTPFTSQVFNASDDTYNVGIGFTFLSCACSARAWELEAEYNHYWTRDNYSANEGMIKFASRF